MQGPSPGSSAGQGRARPPPAVITESEGCTLGPQEGKEMHTRTGSLLCTRHWHHGPHLVSGTQRHPPARKQQVQLPAFCYLWFLEESLGALHGRGMVGTFAERSSPPEAEPDAQARRPRAQWEGAVTGTGRGPGGMTGGWEGKLRQDTPGKPAAPGPRPLLPTAPLHATRAATRPPGGHRTGWWKAGFSSQIRIPVCNFKTTLTQNTESESSFEERVQRIQIMGEN